MITSDKENDPFLSNQNGNLCGHGGVVSLEVHIQAEYITCEYGWSLTAASGYRASFSYTMGANVRV